MTTATLDFTVAHVPEQTFAYVVRRVGRGEASEFVPGAIERVRAFAESRGGVTGPPMTISSAPDEAGALVLEAGWPVPAGTLPEAPVEVQTLPATVALVHLHVGSYEELAVLYQSLLRAAHEQGYTPVAAPRERYLTIPGEGPPVTEIVWPVG
jgi:effector-binding domain-containing protein